MKEINIEFNVSGRFTQTIQILTKDTPEQFIEKLNNGTYITTLGGDGESIKYVLEIGNGFPKAVGKIVYTHPKAGYNDFELAQDEMVADTENDIYSG